MQAVKYWRKNLVFSYDFSVFLYQFFQFRVATETAIVQKFKIQTFPSVELFYRRRFLHLCNWTMIQISKAVVLIFRYWGKFQFLQSSFSHKISYKINSHQSVVTFFSPGFTKWYTVYRQFCWIRIHRCFSGMCSQILWVYVNYLLVGEDIKQY